MELSRTLTRISEREVLSTLAVNRYWSVRPDTSQTTIPALVMTKSFEGKGTVTMRLEFYGEGENELEYVKAWLRTSVRNEPVIADISDPDSGKRCFITATALIGGHL